MKARECVSEHSLPHRHCKTGDENNRRGAEDTKSDTETREGGKGESEEDVKSQI